MDFSFEVYIEYFWSNKFLFAALITLSVAIIAQTIGVILGTVLALFQLSEKKALIYFANSYIWVWRGTPPLIQLFLLYFGLAQLGFRLSAIEAGIFGLGCYSSAYMSEIIRAAIISIHADQLTAARSMGFSWIQTMRFIIVPQSIRIILPPFGNEFASMMRTTSLLSVISFEELLRVTRIAINETYSVMELYAVAATYYLIMYTVWLLIQQYLEKLASKGTHPRSGENKSIA